MQTHPDRVNEYRNALCIGMGLMTGHCSPLWKELSSRSSDLSDRSSLTLNKSHPTHPWSLSEYVAYMVKYNLDISHNRSIRVEVST